MIRGQPAQSPLTLGAERGLIVMRFYTMPAQMRGALLRTLIMVHQPSKRSQGSDIPQRLPLRCVNMHRALFLPRPRVRGMPRPIKKNKKFRPPQERKPNSTRAYPRRRTASKEATYGKTPQPLGVTGLAKRKTRRNLCALQTRQRQKAQRRGQLKGVLRVAPSS